MHDKLETWQAGLCVGLAAFTATCAGAATPARAPVSNAPEGRKQVHHPNTGREGEAKQMRSPVPRKGGQAAPSAVEGVAASPGDGAIDGGITGIDRRPPASDATALGDRSTVVLFRDPPQDPDRAVADAVRRSIRGQMDVVARCYGLHAASELATPRVSIRFRVLQGGAVTEAAVVDETRYRPTAGDSYEGSVTEHETALAQCLLELVQRLQLDLPPEAPTPVEVVYPFQPDFSG